MLTVISALKTRRRQAPCNTRTHTHTHRWNTRSALLSVSTLAREDAAAEEEGEEKDEEDTASASHEPLDVNSFLQRAHMLSEGGVRAQHRDVLRAYQTATRLLCDGRVVLPGEGDRGRALMQIHLASLGAALDHWGSSEPPPPAPEHVRIHIPTIEAEIDVPLLLPRDKGGEPGEAVAIDAVVPARREHVLLQLARTFCALDVTADPKAAAAAATHAALLQMSNDTTLVPPPSSLSPPTPNPAVTSDDAADSDVECQNYVARQLLASYLALEMKRRESTPPRQIPPELWQEFTDGGTTVVLNWYRDDSYS